MRPDMDHAPAQPIAIVGIAAALPGGGGDLDRFAALLEDRADLVRPDPEDRRRDAGTAPGTPLPEAAFPDRVATVDHALYGLHLCEARQAHPHHSPRLEPSCKP